MSDRDRISPSPDPRQSAALLEYGHDDVRTESLDHWDRNQYREIAQPDADDPRTPDVPDALQQTVTADRRKFFAGHVYEPGFLYEHPQILLVEIVQMRRRETELPHPQERPGDPQ